MKKERDERKKKKGEPSEPLVVRANQGREIAMVSLLSQNANWPFRYSRCTFLGYTELSTPPLSRLPPLFSSKPLVQQSEHLGNIELNVFEIELILVVLLHLEQVIQLKVKLQKTSVATFVVEGNNKRSR